MITIENLTFSYSKSAELLNNLSLNIEAGRIHGLLGKNGEGKSTLLKLISGLVFAHTGNLETMGFNPNKRSPEMLQEIFFLPEELPQVNLSIAQYEKVYAPFYPNFSTDHFDSYLKEFNVEDKKKNLSKLSHGQKKKVMIAFGLATNTKLIFDGRTYQWFGHSFQRSVSTHGSFGNYSRALFTYFHPPSAGPR